jgi:hypothetical protein
MLYTHNFSSSAIHENSIFEPKRDNNKPYTFKSVHNDHLYIYSCQVEPKTGLLIIYEIGDGYDLNNCPYIRLTGQQVERLRKNFGLHSFSSCTIPRNNFLEDGKFMKIVCSENNQKISLNFADVANLYNYYIANKDRIARLDIQFNSRRY